MRGAGFQRAKQPPHRLINRGKGQQTQQDEDRTRNDGQDEARNANHDEGNANGQPEGFLHQPILHKPPLGAIDEETLVSAWRLILPLTNR